MSLDSLRAQCRVLRLPVAPQWRLPGATKANDAKDGLAKEQCEAVIRRQAKENEVLQDVTHQSNAAMEPSREAHAFWVTPPGNGQEKLEDIRTVTGKMIPCCIVGLFTAVARAGLSVFLWTYHMDIHDLTEGVVLKNAEGVLPFRVMLRMKQRGYAWGNIADIIRIKGGSLTSRLLGFWVFDLDCWWLKQMSRAQVPSTSGGVIGLQAAKNRVNGDRRFWTWRYLRRPHERAYSSTPIYFSPESKVLDRILPQLEDIPERPPKASS